VIDYYNAKLAKKRDRYSGRRFDKNLSVSQNILFVLPEEMDF
jgi:hypothetical protein